MVIKYPGVQKYFLYDIPPLLFARFELNKPRRKLIEGRIISLESFLQSGYYSRVVARRLMYGTDDLSVEKLVKFVSKKVHSFIEIEEKENDLHYQRLNSVAKYNMVYNV